MSDASNSTTATKHPAMYVITIIALIVAIVTFVLVLVFVNNQGTPNEVAQPASDSSQTASKSDSPTKGTSYGAIEVDYGNYYIHDNNALGKTTDQAPRSIDDVEYQVPSTPSTEETLPMTSFGY